MSTCTSFSRISITLNISSPRSLLLFFTIAFLNLSNSSESKLLKNLLTLIANLRFLKSVQILIKDVNEPPTGISLAHPSGTKK